ncbi:porin family protein, partial [bacterium]|nr:porin family protein [bacterium]
EWMLRFRPHGNNRLNIQFGKSATIFGNWVPQHEFHDDPFLLAPLPYSQITGIHPRVPGAISQAAIAGRVSVYGNSIFRAPKENWASTIWGPSYSTGLSLIGAEGKFDYAFEVKNSGLSSLPDQWDPSLGDFDDPTFTARLGYRSDAAWALGLSFSRGPYLEPEGEKFLPAGMDRGDLPQTVIGLDARWAHRDLIISGEIIASEYETLEVGDLRSLSYYLQARWKAAPGLWLAARFGQIFHNSADGPGGTSLEWAPDHWRAELSAGYRFTPDLLVKAQYSYTQATGDPAGFANHLAGLGVGWKF